jgi:hypothetical protein
MDLEDSVASTAIAIVTLAFQACHQSQNGSLKRETSFDLGLWHQQVSIHLVGNNE